MKKRTTIAQVLAIAAGLAATGTSQKLNLEAVSMQAGASAGEFASVIVAGSYAAIGLAFATCAWRGNHRAIAVMIAATWTLAFALDGHKTWERKQFTAAERTKAAADHNAPILRVKAAIAEAQKMAQRAHQAVLAEMESGGCGRKCRDKKQLRAEGEAKLAEARKLLANQPALIKMDERANRYQEEIDAAWALFLSLTASVLLAYGFAGTAPRARPVIANQLTEPSTPATTPEKRVALDDASALDLVLHRGDRNGGTVPEGINDLAKVLGWSTGKTSKMTTIWAKEGLIRKEKQGKRSVIMTA